jgi:hypothetical protein
VWARAAWAALTSIGVLFVGYLGEAVKAPDVTPSLASFMFAGEWPSVGDHHPENQAIPKDRIGSGPHAVKLLPRNFEADIFDILLGRYHWQLYQPVIADDYERRISTLPLIAASDADSLHNSGQFSPVRYTVDERGVILNDPRGRSAPGRGVGDAWASADQSPNENVGPFGNLKSLGGSLGSLGASARRLVSTDQKKDLDAGDGSEERGKNGENKRIEGNWIVPRPVPDYRKRLPEGFGWLILIAIGIGGGIGLAYVLLIVWMVNRPDKTAAYGESYDRSKQRPK